MNCFVESVEIHEQEQEDGRFLKRLKFRFPIYFNNEEVSEISLDKSWDSESTVETVVLLSKLKPDDIVKVEIDLDELDATPAEMKATYQEIKEYISQKYGLKAHTAYISQIKRKCGIEMRLNYNLSKKENSKARPCPPYMEEAIYDALKHFAMV